jgi:type IV pilus assembly protein PilM
MFCIFRKKSIGIDIADHRIWVTRLRKSGRNFVVDSLNGKKLKSGIVENGRIKDKKELAKAVTSLMDEIKAESSCEKKIVFGLPKNQVFVHVFSDSSGNTDSKYIKQIVKKSTEESIPLESDDIYYNYKILDKSSEETVILVIAVSRSLIYEWQDFFASLEIDVQVYDLSSLATFRNLYRKEPKEPICMLDIGGDSTSITIFDKKGLRYSHAITIAGESFTEKIAESLNISFAEAEKLKQKNGLVKDEKIAGILDKELNKIINTVKEILDYLYKDKEEEVEKIILVGGSSLVKGLKNYFKEKLGKPVELGKPLLAQGKKSFEYLNSIGLALRGFEKRSRQKDPGLLPLEKKRKNIKKEEEISDEDKEEEFSDKYLAEDIDKTEDNLKIQRQKKILLLILFLGIFLIGGAFWYRNWNSDENSTIGNVDTNLFPHENTLVLEVPVAISDSELTRDRVEGRLVESQEAILKNDESLWTEPVLKNPDRWLVYSQEDISKIIFADIKEKIGNKFSIENLNYLDLIYTENSNLLLLKVKVIFYSKEEVSLGEDLGIERFQPTEKQPEIVSQEERIEEIATSSQEIEPELKKILKIKDTPTNWLNVREGAGLKYPIIQKVDSGEEFEYVEENNSWYKIILDDELSGWVSGEYITILNN